MLLLNTVKGNIYHDSSLTEQSFQSSNPNFKRLVLSRHELEKKRFRKKTTDGTEVGISLESSSGLKHGDVLEINEIKILILQEPEDVIQVKITEKVSSIHTLVTLGHIIGNRHRPIEIDNEGTIFFPINSNNELELFKSLLHDIIDKLELSIVKKVFQPNQSMDVHDHG